MKNSKYLKLIIQSAIDDFRNYYPDSLDIYFQTIKDSLINNDYEKIYFCFCKIYDYYKLDIESNKSFEIFLNSKYELEKFLQISKKEKKEKNLLYKFWVSFSEWFKLEKDKISTIFLEKYISGHYEYDPLENQYWVNDCIILDEEAKYKIEYGEIFTNPNETNINIDVISNYVEMIYKNYLKNGKNGKYIFAIKVNETFQKFGLPYKIKNGIVKTEEYKSTYDITQILNYEQFERKIIFSEQMIIHNDLMDKHTALEYISDCFCYFTSLFTGKKEDKNKKIALLITNNSNSNVYKDFIKELDYIYDIVNNSYDIRHNDYYNTKTKEPREPLIDGMFIEYLYNRIYAILYVLRLKYNKGDKND